ncbi:MAG: GtrA family protein [Gallionella sp.]|jgi:putative flippase GtrA|nr:GtrA family protein [Gallionella sp.]
MAVPRQFGRFVLAGAVAAVINVASRIVYGIWVDYSASILLAYLTGMIAAFVLVRRYVFSGGRNSVQRSAFYFTLVNAAALAQTWLVSIMLAEHVFPDLGLHHHAETLAHVVGVGVPVFTSYFGHREWSFR